MARTVIYVIVECKKTYTRVLYHNFKYLCRNTYITICPIQDSSFQRQYTLWRLPLQPLDCKKKPFNGFDTLMPEKIGRHFADDIFKCMSLNKIFWTLNVIDLCLLVNDWQKSTLIHVMAWYRQTTSHYWINVDTDLWRHMVPLGLNELKPIDAAVHGPDKLVVPIYLFVKVYSFQQYAVERCE